MAAKAQSEELLKRQVFEDSKKKLKVPVEDSNITSTKLFYPWGRKKRTIKDQSEYDVMRCTHTSLQGFRQPKRPVLTKESQMRWENEKEENPQKGQIWGRIYHQGDINMKRINFKKIKRGFNLQKPCCQDQPYHLRAEPYGPYNSTNQSNQSNSNNFQQKQNLRKSKTSKYLPKSAQISRKDHPVSLNELKEAHNLLMETINKMEGI